MQLHGWFKPRFRFTVDGQPWLTDGRISVAVSPDAVSADLPEHPTAAEVTDREYLSRVVGFPVSQSRTERGYAYFGERIFQAHYVALCEAAHPGMIWRATNEEVPSLVGFHGAAPVAVVAGVRGEPAHDARVFPPCPECNGKGGPECATCDGSGWDECPHCGNEDECDDCNGEGHTDGCAACDGTGEWKPPQNEAA